MTYTTQQFDIALEPGLTDVRNEDGTYLVPVKVVIISESGTAWDCDERADVPYIEFGAQIDAQRVLGNNRLGYIETLHLKEAEHDGKNIDWFPELFRQAVAIMTARRDHQYFIGRYEGGVLTVTEPEAHL